MEHRRTNRRWGLFAALLAGLGVLAVASVPAAAIQTVAYRAGITQGPAGGVAAIAAGPDGNLWFTERAGRIGRITPAGVVTEFGGFSPLLGIAAGSDGAIWVAEGAGLGRIAVDGAARSSFPLGPGASGEPFWLASGPDGALWFTLTGGGPSVGRMTTAGAVSLFTPSYRDSRPAQIVLGPDRALWYTEEGTALEPEHPSAGTTFRGIVRVTTAGAITPFPLRASGVSPLALAAGPDGAVWFAASSAKIGRLTTAGRYTLFDARLPRNRSAGSIVTGPDGNLWYGIGGGLVGRMTTKGFATIFRTPSRDFAPGELAVGTDRAVWMTDQTGGIVKIVPPRGRCVVPALVGLRYPRATRRLHRAGCAVGRVSAPRGAHRRRLSVTRQLPHGGTRLPAESTVDLTLRR